MNKEKMNYNFTRAVSAKQPEWFDLNRLGDSCLGFEYFHADKDYAQFAYISLDSTEVFYHDAIW